MVEKVFLSKKTAVRNLMDAGFTGNAAKDAVAKMKKTVFGKREKVKASDVRLIIYNASLPTPEPKMTIRPCVPRSMRGAA